MEQAPSQYDIFKRFIQCEGEDLFNYLQTKTILQIGCGAVGGQSAECMIRCGIKNIIIVDFDTVEASNINRQIVATCQNIGKIKVEVFKQRALEINPQCNITPLVLKVDETNFPMLIGQYKPDIVVECIDLFFQKCQIIEYCIKNNIQLISSMGAARKRDFRQIRVGLLKDLQVDPLSKKVKQRLGELTKQCKNVQCVFSIESAMPHPKDEQGNKMSLPSYAIITNIFGSICADLVIQTIEKQFKQQLEDNINKQLQNIQDFKE